MSLTSTILNTVQLAQKLFVTLLINYTVYLTFIYNSNGNVKYNRRFPLVRVVDGVSCSDQNLIKLSAISAHWKFNINSVYAPIERTQPTVTDIINWTQSMSDKLMKWTVFKLGVNIYNVFIIGRQFQSPLTLNLAI